MRVLRNQKRNDDTDKPKTLSQIKKQEQTRFKQYWKQLQRENNELIHTMTEEIKQSDEQTNIQHIQTLKLLLLEPNKIEGIIPKLKQLANELIKILKKAILAAIDNMPASQREFYQEIRKTNLKLVEISQKNKRYPNRFSDNTVEKLFHLDVTSLMLRQNQIFKKEWWHFESLWTGDELYEFSLIPTYPLRLYKRHQSCSDYLRQINHHKKINDIVIVLALVRTRIRLANFLNQRGQFPFLIDIEKERQQRQRAERENNDYQPDFRFKFSQIANLSIKNQLQQLPSGCKASYYETLQSIMNQRSLREKKYLILSAKINYNLSIRAILQNLSHFEQMDEQQLMQHFEQAVQEEHLANSEELNTFMKFQDQWKYFFLKDYTFQETLEQSSMREDFIQAFSTCNKSHYIHHYLRGYLLAASLSSFSDYTQYGQKLLFLESITRSFIIIKTYELTYPNMRTGSIAEQETEEQSRTLLLGTVNSKVLFFYLFKGKLSSYKYFLKIKQGIKQNPIHQKFITILFEQDFKQNYSKFLKETKNFVKYLTYCYESRAYISTYNKYCDQNLYIFKNLSCQLNKNSKKMTKTNFSETLEDEVKGVLTIFK